MRSDSLEPGFRDCLIPHSVAVGVVAQRTPSRCCPNQSLRIGWSVLEMLGQCHGDELRKVYEPAAMCFGLAEDQSTRHLGGSLVD